MKTCLLLERLLASLLGVLLVSCGATRYTTAPEVEELTRYVLVIALPRGFGHMTSGGRGKGRKKQWCRDQCWQSYLDCQELQDRRPQEFSAVDEAVDWLKRHPRGIMVGSIVVIAGVAFVTVSAGAGLVVLAPAALLAS